MKYDLFYDSRGAGRIHGSRWEPNGEPKAVVQIVHGISEHIARYEPFAKYLNSMGYVVVAEDHMGHGRSISEECCKGYFHGGWFAAVEDTRQLMRYTMKKYPGIPYILFGHSMGSFMARTILAKYPNSGIATAIICGTGWQNSKMVKAAQPMFKLLCRVTDESVPSEMMQKMMFGALNHGIENPRTACDWLSRDSEVVDAYLEDPLCGFPPSTGLVRDMYEGIRYIQDPVHIAAMKKDLPVFFIAGAEDSVGGNGAGVEKCAQAFRDAGMEQISVKIYPDCRHELLNELNKHMVYEDITNWIESTTILQKYDLLDN